MDKIRKLFILSVLFFSLLEALELGVMSPEYALKRIDNTNITFISAEDISHGIHTTKILDVERLINHDILGRTSCPPFSLCPNRIEMILRETGISKEDKLIIYDNSYGIKASTLYVILESIGHKKLRLLNGNFRAIKALDPNQLLYDELLGKYNKFLDDENQTKVNNASSLDILKTKMKVLEPLLLFISLNQASNITSNYHIKKDDLNTKYLIGKPELLYTVTKIRKERSSSKMKLIDTCSLVDILGNQSGSYVSGVTSIDWRALVDKEKRGYKSLSELKQLFKKANINKEDENYLYCMSGSPKAFYVLYALRMVGYKHVKVFTGDWNVWIGDENVKD